MEMDEWIDGWMGGQVGRQMDGQADRWTDDGWMHDRWIDRGMGIQIHGQVGRQILNRDKKNNFLKLFTETKQQVMVILW